MTSADQQPRGGSQRRGIYITVGIVIAVAAVLVGGFFYSFTQARMMTVAELKADGAYLYENPRMLPKFSLVNDQDEVFKAQNLKGQWNLLFFGFTYCPDVCPTTLAQLKDFYQQLEPEVQADTQIWLVSVDPARDTPQQLNNYLAFFHPEFRGVTGEFLEIHRFATALNIPFTKVPNGGSNYLVDHSANVALVNPQGHSVGFFKAPLEISRLTRTFLSIRAHY